MVELKVLRVDSEVLHGTRSSSIIPVIEVADVNINNPTKATASHTPAATDSACSGR